MLRDLVIENYRLFSRFELADLARVNLIVGMNNCGKSSLLEAIYLLAGQGEYLQLFDILSERGEFEWVTHNVQEARKYYQLSHLFYKHNLQETHPVKIQSMSEHPISLKLRLSENAPIPTSSARETIDDFDGEHRQLILEYSENGNSGSPKKFRIQDGGLVVYPDLRHRGGMVMSKQHIRFISTRHLEYEELARLWDNITLTPKEDKVVESLKILEPDIERISFTSRQTSNSGVLIKLRGERDPIPLGSMGDGTRRILALAASLVSAENGTLLVDEIDTGLHHETLVDMWKLLFETADKLNVQVFATTHSGDCVKSFQETLQEKTIGEKGRLIRLVRRDDRVTAVTYSSDELKIALQQDIEVR